MTTLELVKKELGMSQEYIEAVQKEVFELKRERFKYYTEDPNLIEIGTAMPSRRLDK